MSIRVAIDSASNYRKIEGIDYAVAALSICTDEREFKDDASLYLEDMINYMEHTKKPSHSACPSVAEWMDAFGDAEEVFAIALAASLSGSYNSCVTAANQYMEEHPGRKVHTLDTCSIGPVEKLVVEHIKEKIAEGKTFDEISESMDKYCKDDLHIAFCLKSLANLANNGRINPTVAKIAQTLKIHIVGDFDPTGILQPKDKVRGEKKALQQIFTNMKAAGYHGGKVMIDHCLAPEAANQLKNLILSEYPEAPIVLDTTTGLCTFYAERGGLVIGYERA